MESIDSIGEKAAAQVKAFVKRQNEAEGQATAASIALSQVWKALEAKQEVNGCRTKSAWAKKWGVTTRSCQYILKGKRDRSAEVKKRDANHVVRSTFLNRIDDAKKKLADIQREMNAPCKPGEFRNAALFARIDSVLNPVYEEFLALISPDGYEVRRAAKNSWNMQEKGEPKPEPLTHIRMSARKSLCEQIYVNRKLKGKVWAADGADPTCSDCRSIRDERKAQVASAQDKAKRREAEDRAAAEAVHAQQEMHPAAETFAATVAAQVTLVMKENCPKDYSEEDVKNLFEGEN